MNNPPRIGIIGMGGYARDHHEAVRRLEELGLVRLICACDPREEAFSEHKEAWRFSARKVRVFRDYRTMLSACAKELDVIVVPTPIQLHREMHQACVEAGVACYLEKPPTLVYTELEAMIETDLAAEKKTFVGFNYISEPARLAVKQRIIAGEFGAVVRGDFVALWRRAISYFRRSNWSGRLRHQDQLVLDSCFGNAMAHFVHNMLFWVGQETLYSWGTVGKVRAELYRANAIEGADTFFVEAFAGGVPIRFALTHACEPMLHQVETIVCERAVIRYIVGRNVEIDWHDGKREIIPLKTFSVPDENYRDYFRYLRGECSRPSTTLKDCRPFVHLNDLAYISSGTIDTVSPDRLALVPSDEEGEFLVTITGLESDIAQFINSGIWPSENGWGREARPLVVTPEDLPLLTEVVLSMSDSITPYLSTQSLGA